MCQSNTTEISVFTYTLYENRLDPTNIVSVYKVY